MNLINGLSLPIQLRLRTLETLLNHYGYVNRDTLCDLHGLNTVAISKDIAKYKLLNPEAIFYNRSSRRIEKLSNFTMIFD